MIRPTLFTILYLAAKLAMSQNSPNAPREKLLMDFEWTFAFGHPYDTKKDFNHGTGYFSYWAKAGYGDGPASPKFDDRAWRKLNLPHDWAAEALFDGKASLSHGYKAIGRNFPETSVGWYRKSFFIPASDLGRKMCIAFDGVSRNSIVWINGFYLGTEPSGYRSFQYDITDFINYGGENVIAVRADVTMEEGWYYEGAGIYRHVWLTKTQPLHVAKDGTSITTEVKDNNALVSIHTTITNEGKVDEKFDIVQTIIDQEGKTLASGQLKEVSLHALEIKDLANHINIANPKLWSVESPYLHKLITTVTKENIVIDKYETSFGIRTIHFDANKGFFLNGKSVKLKGTNNHQDHAGVGTALPDALQDYRIVTLKGLGSNAYRCSHNPPTPELLDACDRLGMLVIDENRLMGSTTEIKELLKDMIIRDRNHPSIIAWSIGNEEWAIEGDIKGARIASTMQDFVKTIDATRPVTAAVSGAREGGISTVIEIMGYNYLGLGLTEEHHAKFPTQPSMGTEEGSTFASRGIYNTDEKRQYIAAYDKKPRSDFFSIEDGWTYYAARDYLAGMFIWTGFDYRGESTPHQWPSVYSYFGMFDACGFPKDNVYYLKSWWGDKPVLHILPHWNWKGKEGKEIDVWAYSNCDEVELFLNKKSLGKKVMKRNSHLVWKVNYKPGTLEAIGFKQGKKIVTDIAKTTEEASSIKMTTDKGSVKANREDVAVITVQAVDKNNLSVPTADNEITFSIQGPGKIIGVGNGDQTSHEADRSLETVLSFNITGFKEKEVENFENRAEVAIDFDDSTWPDAFHNDKIRESAKAIMYRGSFTLPENFMDAEINLFYSSIGKEQTVYLNGKELGKNISENQASFKLDKSILHTGKNSIAVIAMPLKKKNEWDNLNTNAGIVQLILPAAPWKRKLFNGLAQVIVQSTAEPGEITLTAFSSGLKQYVLKLQSVPSVIRPAVGKK